MPWTARRAAAPGPGTANPMALLQISEPERRRAARAALAVGIDLGTTNSLVAHVPQRHRGRAARRGGAARCCRRSSTTAPRRRRTSAAAAAARAAARPAEHHRLGQALHGPRPRRPARRPRACPTASSTRPRMVAAGATRAGAPVAGRGLGRDPARAARRAPRRASAASSSAPSSPCPAYFDDAQRQATKDAGAARRPRGAAPAQRADRRGARLRPRQRGRRAPTRSTTSAAAPSTSRSCELSTRRVRGAGDRRRLGARRRRLRPPRLLLGDRGGGHCRRCRPRTRAC